MSAPHVSAETARPPRKTAIEIVSFGLIGIGLTAVLLAFPYSGVTPHIWFQRAHQAGLIVMDNIGWALGVYSSVLLGFYGIVIGGQFGKSPDAAKNQRLLGAIAEALTGAFASFLFLVIIACIDHPQKVGILFLLLPATSILYVLAAFLGSMIIFPDHEQAAEAEKTIEWATTRLGDLSRRGRKPPLLVVVMHSLASSTIGVALAVLIAPAAYSLVWLVTAFIVFFFIAGLLCAVSLSGVLIYQTARESFSRWLAVLMTPLLYLLSSLLALSLYSNGWYHVGAAVTVVIIGCAVSTLWPRQHMRQVVLDWTLKGSGTRYSATELHSMRAKSRGKLLRIVRRNTAATDGSTTTV